ncbi:hypothetical protein I5677_11460 [Mobilitalea sibirica]|uniref:Uncharacterized protein n=1 Tax=Mobilitalea sibirica TaxID=1462919 RepID=A0A8J7KTL3_9FIRM|nr:hypothetical protein [Mobilitalea sibirica]MBH1941511.1 hypothetical protein [Mobilitalea sibirica]
MGFMGLFSSKKARNRQKDIGQNEPKLTALTRDGKKSVSLGTKSDRITFIKDNCELITESERRIEEAKIEYQAVTSYLTDMQKIDLIPSEQRELLEDAARQIFNLNKERSKFQKKSSNISDIQYRMLERYEMQIPKELAALKESEQYQGVIQKDIEYLDKEKQGLQEAEKDIINKQGYLKGISITTFVIVILLFGFFALLSNYTKANLTLPFLLTVLMGMASSLYIFMETRKNTHDLKVIGIKQNRQIMLMNKVKIKSVNNRNFLEYSYSKYMVDSYEHLKSLWEEYVRIKDETRRYQNNTELLEFYNNQLIQELKKFHIKDSEIWIYQPSAILDNREMVEVRHRLNVRRQKLREGMDTNTKQKEEALHSIKKTLKAYPDCIDEVGYLLQGYHISLED